MIDHASDDDVTCSDPRLIITQYLLRFWLATCRTHHTRKSCFYWILMLCCTQHDVHDTKWTNIANIARLFMMHACSWSMGFFCLASTFHIFTHEYNLYDFISVAACRRRLRRWSMPQLLQWRLQKSRCKKKHTNMSQTAYYAGIISRKGSAKEAIRIKQHSFEHRADNGWGGVCLTHHGATPWLAVWAVLNTVSTTQLRGRQVAIVCSSTTTCRFFLR